ncbi:hypothetical protein ACN20G_34650 (plasmid) [Streptomyces sp. BI20]|uniref:bestrophin-like domain n=1 Tax=Streptomyces sp. BI20 TaxID=3403460 RepID=UPI003C748911
MVWSAVIAVGIGAAASVGMALVGLRISRSGSMPDTGPAVGNAAGVVFSFFVITLAFLMVSSAQNLATARQNNYAEAGALMDIYLTARDVPQPVGRELRDHSRRYAHLVIDEEWPAMEHGHMDTDTWAMAYGLQLLSTTKMPEATKPAAAGAARDASLRLLQQRRMRVADVQGGMPPVMLGTTLGAAALALAFLVLIGWPGGRRGFWAIAALGAVCAYGIWLVIQLNHAYAGIHVEPSAFREALVRMDFVDSHGI